MCGRYTSTSSSIRLAEVFDVDEVKSEPLPIRYNVAPSQEVYAVAESRPGLEWERPCRQLGTFRWGLVPPWARNPSVGNRMINARAEGITTKRAFNVALARRRCIIPADAFYEWQPTGGSPARRPKLPYVILHRDRSLLAFAGLWEVWRSPGDPQAAPLRTCAIITTEANDLLAPIHERMPVVLAQDAWACWLDPGNPDLAALQRLLVPAPSTEFEVHPVASLVNKVDNEGPELIAPIPPRPERPTTATASEPE